MSKHFVASPPPYEPAGPAIIGEPDANGCVVTDEAVQAFAWIDEVFGNLGPGQRRAANYFLRDPDTTFPATTNRQVVDVGNFAELDDGQIQAVKYGTAGMNFLATLVLPARTPTNASDVTGAAMPPNVRLANQGSIYNWIIKHEFQHNLNVAYDGLNVKP